MPVVSRAPIWRDPSPGNDARAEGSTTGKCPHGRAVRGAEENAKQDLKNKISRHREDVSASVGAGGEAVDSLIVVDVVDGSNNATDVLVSTVNPPLMR